MTNLSVIIPAWNEQENIHILIGRLATAIQSKVKKYEILVIDDFSDDETVSLVKGLKRTYPVKVFTKKGERGKAQSLLQGFAEAKYELLAMIDADLQYPPEALPQMIDVITSGQADVVVADRQYQKVSRSRQFLSHGFKHVFGKMLHGLDVDVQSGLKVFRREIIQRVELNPSQWTFDLEFLLKAINAGYQVTSVTIPFFPRHGGQSKVKVLQSMWEIGSSAVKQKFQPMGPAPFLPEKMDLVGQGFHFRGKEYVHHTSLHEDSSALFQVTRHQKVALAAASVGTLTAGVIDWHSTIFAVVAFLTGLYFLDLLFYLYLIYKSFTKPGEISVNPSELGFKEHYWPSYTVFCPLYKEWQVIPQFVNAMDSLDYPKDKLQVMLLLEQDDTETTDEVKKMKLPSYFEVVVVPHSLPKTKPKACNYGLRFATGEYSVIYDAEDVPDPQQLKKAVLAFGKSDPSVICIQAKLNFYNPTQNLLTRIFTAEYSLWFDLILTGLQAIDAPIPLGGTSNHFKTASLKEIEGWDSFNVTEDCDLGVRLSKKGFRTALINSVTLEEANSDLKNWFWQRTRWIKGYIQTYLVHMRRPKEFLLKTRPHHLPIFQLVVGGKVGLALVNPIMWLITGLYFTSRVYVGDFIESFFPPAVLYMGVFSLIVGNFLYFYYYMIGCARRGQYNLIKYTFFVPFYWLAMSAAAWMAMFQLLVRPHHWSKTKHGLHLNLTQESSLATQLLVAKA